MSRAISTLFAQIGMTESVAALWALMVRYYREKGFDAAAYILFDRGRLGQAVAILEYGFPPEVMETYAELGYGQHDAVLRVAMSTGRPERRSRIIERFKLSRDEIWHREAMQALGVGEVLGLPLFGPHGRDALGALAGARHHHVFEAANLTELHMAAQAAHLRAFALRPMPGQELDGLSLREVEILRLIAQGKSNSVIAVILGIAPGTVDTYLRRIFDKLGVADRTSAAVKGVSLGLIRA